MNEHINFIHTPPTHKQQSVYQWYRWSLYAIVSTLFILVSITILQWYGLKAYNGSHTQLLHVATSIDALSERVTKLTDAQQQLATRHKKLHKPTGAKFAPATYLQKIAQLVPDDTCLYTTELYKKGTIQLTGYTESAQSLRQFVSNVEASPYFHNVQLTSLQPEGSTNSTLYGFALTAQLQSPQ